MRLISVGNLIPCPAAGLGTATCVICRSEMTLNHRGNYLAADSFVCDDCGMKLRPELSSLLHKLRQAVNFVPTIGGSESRVCPTCGDLVESDAVAGWHVVSVISGQPVCDDCMFDQDPATVGLCHVLNALHRAEALARMEIH